MDWSTEGLEDGLFFERQEDWNGGQADWRRTEGLIGGLEE